MPIYGNPFWIFGKALDPKYSWTQYSKFISSGLGASSWASTDGTRSITLANGTWTVSDGKLVADGSSGFRTNIPGPNILVGIRCTVPSTFTPSTSSQWYNQSCIFGYELGNRQKDYALTIRESDGIIYPCVGYAMSSYTQSSTPLPLDEECELFLLYTGSVFTMFLNRNVILTVSYIASGSTSSKIGIFWNNSVAGSKVAGTISAFGVWQFTDIGGTDIILPSLN